MRMGRRMVQVRAVGRLRCAKDRLAGAGVADSGEMELLPGHGRDRMGRKVGVAGIVEAVRLGAGVDLPAAEERRRVCLLAVVVAVRVVVLGAGRLNRLSV